MVFIVTGSIGNESIIGFGRVQNAVQFFQNELSSKRSDAKLCLKLTLPHLVLAAFYAAWKGPGSPAARYD